VYYNQILCLWILDPFDYYLINAIVTSLITSYLKNISLKDWFVKVWKDPLWLNRTHEFIKHHF